MEAKKDHASRLSQRVLELLIEQNKAFLIQIQYFSGLLIQANLSKKTRSSLERQLIEATEKSQKISKIVENMHEVFSSQDNSQKVETVVHEDDLPVESVESSDEELSIEDLPVERLNREFEKHESEKPNLSSLILSEARIKAEVSAPRAEKEELIKNENTFFQFPLDDNLMVYSNGRSIENSSNSFQRSIWMRDDFTNSLFKQLQLQSATNTSPPENRFLKSLTKDTQSPQPIEEKKDMSESSHSQGFKTFMPDDQKMHSHQGIKKARGRYKISPPDLKHKAVQLCNATNIKDVSNLLNLPEKNIKRWIKHGAERKKGAGRRTTDPEMEIRLLEWIRKEFAKNSLVPDCRKIKNQAKAFSNNANFKASKGWCDKFVRRNSEFLCSLRLIEGSRVSAFSIKD